MLLFTQIENEDNRAFMLDVYERFKGLMYSIAREYLPNPDEAEDLVQDCLEKLIRKCQTLQTLNDYALTAYIAFTVKNTALNYLKKQSIRNNLAASEDVDDVCRTDAAPTPEELLLLSERLDEFRVDFARLPLDDRRLLVSKYILDMSDEELAKMFDCKPDSIRMKLTRARRRAIRRFMEGERFCGQV